MAEKIDTYFETLNAGGGDLAKLDELADIFAEDAIFQYSGELIQGTASIIEWHKSHAAGNISFRYHWTAAAQNVSSGLRQWSAAGLEINGNAFSRSGSIKAALREDGKIVHLYSTLTLDGPDRWRAQIGKHLEVLQTENHETRRSLMDEIYTDDITFMESEEIHSGRQAMNDHIDLAQAKPALGSLIVHDVFRNHEYVQYTWTFTNQNGDADSGNEILHFDGERADKIFFFSKRFREVLGTA